MPAETHVVDGPLDRDAIFAIVRDQLVDILEIDPENISEGQSFKDDLNADSLALVELVDALEEVGAHFPVANSINSPSSPHLTVPVLKH